MIGRSFNRGCARPEEENTRVNASGFCLHRHQPQVVLIVHRRKRVTKTSSVNWVEEEGNAAHGLEAAVLGAPRVKLLILCNLFEQLPKPSADVLSGAYPENVISEFT